MRASGFQFLRAPLFFVICSIVATLSLANQAKDIDWEQLIPPHSESLEKELDELQTTIDGLNETERFVFYEIDDQLWLKRRIELGFVEAASLSPEEKTRLDYNYETERPELFALWQRVQKARELAESASDKINNSLDGQTVRIPGYLLPLETVGTAVLEFLLVPYVGACIHVPPPPANQMVYVRLDEPYETDALFEAVWVEGVISTEGGTHELSFVDGRSDVNTGYSMNALKVSKHSN